MLNRLSYTLSRVQTGTGHRFSGVIDTVRTSHGEHTEFRITSGPIPPSAQVSCLQREESSLVVYRS